MREVTLINNEELLRVTATGRRLEPSAEGTISSTSIPRREYIYSCLRPAVWQMAKD